jgi:phosphoenolpyruvate carboxykinase (ATP)
LASVETQHIEGLNLDVPVAVSGVDSNLLVPKNTWENKALYDEFAANLVSDFQQNFEKYDVNDAIVKAGPGN